MGGLIEYPSNDGAWQYIKIALNCSLMSCCGPNGSMPLTTQLARAQGSPLPSALLSIQVY